MYASDPLYDIRRTLSTNHSLQHLLQPIGEKKNAQELGKRPLPFLEAYKNATPIQVPPSMEVLQHNLHPLFQNKAQHGKTSLYGKLKSKPEVSSTPVVDVIPTSTIPPTPSQDELWVPTNTSIDHFLVPLSPPRASNEHIVCSLTPNVVETEVDPWDSIPLAGRSNHTRSLSAESEQSYCNFWCQSPSPSFQSFRKRSSSVIEEYEPCLPISKGNVDITSVSLDPRTTVRVKSPSPHFEDSKHHEEYADPIILAKNVRIDNNVINEDKSDSPIRQSRPSPPQSQSRRSSPSRDDHTSENISQVDASSTDAPILGENRAQEDRTISKFLTDFERLRLSSVEPLGNALETPTPFFLSNIFTKGKARDIKNDPVIETAHKLSSPAFHSDFDEAEQNSSVNPVASAVAVDVGEHSENEKAGSLFSDDEDGQHLPICSQPNPNPNTESSSSANNQLYTSPPSTPKLPTASLPSPPASECGSPRLESNTSLSLPLPPSLMLNSSSSGRPALARNYIQTSHSKPKKGSTKTQRKSANLFLSSSRTTGTASESKPREGPSSSSSLRSLLHPRPSSVPVKEERIAEVKSERKRARNYAEPQIEMKKEETMAVKEEKTPAKKEKTEKATTVKEEKKPTREEKIQRKKRKLIGSERRAAAEALQPRKRLKLQPKVVDKVMVARWVAGIRLQLTLSEAKPLHRVNGELLLKHLIEIDERKDTITKDLWLYPPGKDNLDVFLQMLSENGPTAYEEVWPDLEVSEKAKSLRKYVIQRER